MTFVRICITIAILCNTPLELVSKPMWKTLENGNKKFVTNHEQVKRRNKVKDAQTPPCIVLSCADSRVPPEIIFDQELGQLFVVRTAGEVVDDVVVDSIEFAVRQFKSSTIVVLGHSNCGAVIGALDHLLANDGVPDKPHGHYGAVLIPIERAIIQAKIDINAPDALEQATQTNVRYMAEQLISNSKTIKDAIKAKKLSIVGAEYYLDSGNVKKLFVIN